MNGSVQSAEILAFSDAAAEPTLGVAGHSELKIDLPKLLATRMLIQAASGGGKSYALRRLLEQTHGLVQQIVVDPEGELVTLAETFDYLVCGPDAGHAPIRGDMGADVASLIFESRRSAILVLGEFEIEEMQGFVEDFVRAIMRQPQERWRHVLLAIDEAQLFAPQQDKATSKKAVLDLAARGRKRGLCPVVATQRISQLHKGVVAHLDNKLIGLTTLDVDVERAAEQIGMRAAVAKQQLRRLSAGEFIAYGPALSYDLVTVKVGTVRSRHGALGEFGSLPYEPAMSAEDVHKRLRAMVRASEARSERAERGEAAAEPARSCDETETLRRRVAAVRMEAIRPLLSRRRKHGSVQARATELGVEPHELRNWLKRFVRADGAASLRPRRLSDVMIERLESLEALLLGGAPADE